MISIEALTTYAADAAAVAAELHGATQETIERNTFPHKYRRVFAGAKAVAVDESCGSSSTATAVVRKANDDDEECEKCPICLSKFEMECDVR